MSTLIKMNEQERSGFLQAIKKTKELFQRRRAAEAWSDNLIEGSAVLETASQWKHYYAWMANPGKYNEEEVNGLKTLDEQAFEIEPYHEDLVVKQFKNGTETIIHVTNPSLAVAQDDEKVQVE